MTPPIKPTTPPMGDAPTAFTRTDAGRVAEATRYYERNYRNTVPASRALRPDGGFSGQLFRLTAALNAASSLSAITNASAVDQVISGTTLSDGSGTFTLYNYHDKTFASSAIVWAAIGTGGLWWVIDVRSCASLS